MRSTSQRRWAGLSALAALALGGVLIAPATAFADPAPTEGPTAGGTTVTSTDDIGVRFVSIDATETGALAIDADGDTWVWGTNAYGDFGDGTTDGSTRPKLIAPAPAGVTFTQIAAGSYTTAALGDDGNVYAWGLNSYGQLGNGTQVDSTVPVLVETPAGVTFTRLVAGHNRFYAFGSDGNLYGWGHNNQGQLGDGTQTNSLVPKIIAAPAGVTFTEISPGRFHTLALGSDGNLYGWGYNLRGEVGDGTTTRRTAPVLVHAPAGVTFTQFSSTAQYLSLAIGSDGNTYAWGLNDNGQIGDGTTTNRSLPTLVQVPAGVAFTKVFTGLSGSYAEGNDGNLYAWGIGTTGQLGNGTWNSSSVPVQVTPPAGVTLTFADAVSRAYAIGSDGNTYTWGNGAGPTAGLATPNLTVPTPLTLVTITAVTFGGVAGTNLSQTGTAPGDVSWSADTPPGCGPVDVVVTWSQFGASGEDTTYADGFVYGAAPTAASVTPASQEVAYNGTFTVTAEADGDDAPGLQWQERLADGSWADLAGETSETLTIEGVQADGEYRVVATNCWGSDHAVTSDAATLTVTGAPPGGGGGGTGPGGGGGGTGPGGGGTGGGGAGTGGDGSGAGGDAGAGTAEGGAKGAGSEAWLADTGSGLLWLGVALATAAASFGGILLLGRRRNLTDAV